MSQSMSQVLGQQMRMEQRLTPQLIQSMDILLLNTAALEARVAEELERNCTLEIEEPKPSEKDAEQPAAAAELSPEQAVESAAFNRLERMASEYELEYLDRPFVGGRARSSDGERDAKLEAMANTASRPIGLSEYLLRQWALLDLDGKVRAAGEAIINHLEDDGYLKTRLEEIAKTLRPPASLELLQEVLGRVQGLEPAGVGARDYQECLLLQLEQLPGDNRIEEALIEHHLHDVVRNRYPAIARATGYSVGEITEAVRVITHELVLHPGYTVVDREVPRINPDVIVDFAEVGGGFIIRLTRGNTPRLRVSPLYATMLKDRHQPKQERDFVRGHLESANTLIDAIAYRRRRLLEVAEVIVERQREFFEIGAAGLKVLRMAELAEKLLCDPSTISRTVAGKYMQTPRGVYPLRYFFTGGTESRDGTSTSWDSVKARVREIINKENPQDPLHDDKIAEALRREGIDISRRTVAKYRQQLNIARARHRRVY